jgi:hypothetical protein
MNNGVARLDSLVSEIILRLYGGRCVLCQRDATDAHHWLIGRRHKSVRWNLINIIPLCRECHVAVHDGRSACGLMLDRLHGFGWVDKAEAYLRRADRMAPPDIKQATEGAMRVLDLARNDSMAGMMLESMIRRMGFIPFFVPDPEDEP